MSLISNKFIIPIFTLNQDETIDYYLKIGFEQHAEDSLILKNSNVQLNIYTAKSDSMKNIIGKQDGGIYLFSVQVNDINFYKEYLASNNILIEEIQSPPIGEYLFIRDPNGNRVCIYETYI